MLNWSKKVDTELELCKCHFKFIQIAVLCGLYELCGCVSPTCEFEEKIYHMYHIYNLHGLLELWLRKARFTFVIFVAFVNCMNVSSWISCPGNVVLEKCFVTKFSFVIFVSSTCLYEIIIYHKNDSYSCLDSHDRLWLITEASSSPKLLLGKIPDRNNNSGKNPWEN